MVSLRAGGKCLKKEGEIKSVQYTDRPSKMRTEN